MDAAAAAAAAAVEEALKGDDCKGKGRDALIISLPSFSKDLGHLSLFSQNHLFEN